MLFKMFIDSITPQSHEAGDNMILILQMKKEAENRSFTLGLINWLVKKVEYSKMVLVFVEALYISETQIFLTGEGLLGPKVLFV